MMPLVSFHDIPRLYTGLAEWLACMACILQYKRRLSMHQFIPAAALSLAVECSFLVLTTNIPVYLWIPCMIAAVGLMLAQIMLLCDTDLMTGVYTCIRAFIQAEFIASLQWQIHIYLWPQDDPALWQRYGLLLLIYGLSFLTFFMLERRFRNSRIRISGRDLWIVFIVGVLVFALSNLSFYYRDTPFSGQYVSEILNIRTLVDLGGVAILYAYHINCIEAAARKEIGAMQSVLENQYAQYQMSRNSIEMINRKYHDLKHQIAALRAEPDAAKRDRWLDEMEADIRTYEAQNKTGNSVLDTVLTSKSLFCQEHSIGFTVVADGSYLSFIDVMDICTIFGNALDNAIEYEQKLEETGKRMIHLTVSAQKQFLLIQVENYCPEPVTFRRGLPVTTKSDTDNHGFGLKSIYYTVQKYGGTTSIRQEDNWFVIKMLIPLPKTADTD